MRRGAKGVLSWGSALTLILILSSSAAVAQSPNKGHLVGYIFGRDGSTPVPGAIVVVKNLTTGLTSESGPADASGVFRLAGLDVGIYAVGVRSTAGNYNSRDFFGIAASETSKLTIALDRYDDKTAPAAAIVIKEQREKGEAYVGKVMRYQADTRMAEIFVEIGLIHKDDRIHVKGQETDFYQDLSRITANGLKVDRVTTGFLGQIKASKPCAEGDFVYIVCKRGVPPFFLAPLGVAAIVAGAVPLSAQFEEILSPHRIK